MRLWLSYVVLIQSRSRSFLRLSQDEVVSGEERVQAKALQNYVKVVLDKGPLMFNLVPIHRIRSSVESM